MDGMKGACGATSPPEADQRLRRLVMIVRQACYFVADELGKEYGLERPCKRCEREQHARSRAAEHERLGV